MCFREAKAAIWTLSRFLPVRRIGIRFRLSVAGGIYCVWLRQGTWVDALAVSSKPLPLVSARRGSSRFAFGKAVKLVASFAASQQAERLVARGGPVSSCQHQSNDQIR